MREIVLDGSSWRSSEDVYRSFLAAVGAPPWHGHNFNALRDSIAVGRINEIDVPYTIKITNFDRVGAEAGRMATDFIDLIRELRDSGCPVDVQVE